MAEPHPVTHVKSPKWEGAAEAFNTAYELILRHPRPAVLMLTAYAAIGLLDTVLNGNSLDSRSYVSNVMSVIVALIFSLALPVYGLSLADGKKISLRTAMNGSVKRYVFLVVTYLLATLLFVVSFAAFIIPAIWVIAWFLLAHYPVADKGLNPKSALRRSRELSKNHKGKVWGMIGISLVLTIISSVLTYVPTIGIFISFVAAGAVGILNGVAFAILYRWLERHAER